MHEKIAGRVQSMRRKNINARLSIIIPAVFFSFLLTAATAAAGSAELTRCETLKNERERLSCYDAAAGRNAPGSGVEPLDQLEAGRSAKPAEGVYQPPALSRRWELDPETKNGVWLVRPYDQLYLLPARYTDRTNDSPQSPTHPTTFSEPLNQTEAEFQISFKVKAAENLFWDHADLWFGYTQQSHWQVYSANISRPFRETDFMPEVFLVFPMRYRLFGLTGRFIQLSLAHQSNGRSEPLSRSWNRAYANFGFERGNFALMVRPWYRLKEPIEEDDNPDIHRFMGYGDVTAIYQWGRHEFTLLGRYNAATSYGAAQGTWSFPIYKHLDGFVKVFTGYGETMIDYNWRQTTIGVGIDLVRLL